MKKFSHLMLTAAAAACLAGSLPAQSIPDIGYESTPNFLKLPDGTYLGEVAGAAYNSRGHIFVFTRTGDATATIGTSRTFTHGGGKIFEFDQTGKFVKEIGQGLYGILFPNAIHIDPQDNIWVVDRGASLVIKFDPMGHVIWPMGRKPESINVVVPGGGRGADRFFDDPPDHRLQQWRPTHHRSAGRGLRQAGDQVISTTQLVCRRRQLTVPASSEAC